jgi:methylenetetrahydrofolate dehydrogenase (NADP+) / methenyltetrahydrofolate cyclohydrolase
MEIIDGKKIQQERAKKLSQKIQNLNFVPHLTILQVGNDSASNLYIKNKINFGKEIGVKVTHIKRDENITTKDLCKLIQKLNKDKKVQGIIVQMPIPENIDLDMVLNSIKQEKDVDGLSEKNVYGLIKNKKNIMVPATAKGILSLLQESNISLEGKRVVIIGRSLLVGKSTALNLLNQNATVTICHSKTENLEKITKEADILIVAIGKKHFITDEFLGENQVIIDVGINLDENNNLGENDKFTGDVYIKDKTKVFALTTVPGGVGPMTVLSLFENLILACDLLDQK